MDSELTVGTKVNYAVDNGEGSVIVKEAEVTKVYDTGYADLSVTLDDSGNKANFENVALNRGADLVAGEFQLVVAETAAEAVEAAPEAASDVAPETQEAEVTAAEAVEQTEVTGELESNEPTEDTNTDADPVDPTATPTPEVE